MTIQKYAEQFFSLFRGSVHHYGKYDLKNIKPNGNKITANVNDRGTITGTLTLKNWIDHLEGRMGLGIVPIFEKTKVQWGAIDIDQYDLDHKQLLINIKENKLPLIAIKSKSGGCHCYIFCSEPVEASDMISCLKLFAQRLGVAKVTRKNGNVEDTETYPKQSEVKTDQGDSGNWLNMPYFDFENSFRKCVYLNDGNMYELNIDEFISLARQKLISEPDLLEFLDHKEIDALTQGPPCLNYLLSNDKKINEGGRNNALYNLGVYAKKFDPNRWEDLIEEYNHKYVDPPLKSDEVSSIIKSLKRKDYNYKCDDMPICSVCNPNLCRTRKFGIANSNNFISIDSVSKLLTVPPLFFVNINSKRIECNSGDIYDQRAFGKKCLEYLDFLPSIVKPDVWTFLWNKALENVNLIYPPMDENPVERLRTELLRYCKSRARSQTIEDFAKTEKPFTNEDGYTYFKLNHFKKWLESNNLRDYKLNTLTSMLKINLELEHESLYVKDEENKRKHFNAWKIKTNNIVKTEPLESEQII
jgi:hypothetical protein